MISGKQNRSVSILRCVFGHRIDTILTRQRKIRAKRLLQAVEQGFARLITAGATVACSGLLLVNTVVAQQPTGADVVAGAAVIAVGPSVMDVNATSARTIINWDQFNIGSGQTTNFNLPDASSAVLNRVTTPDLPSVINGTLNSNGHVHLVNPSGIMVGASGIINTNAFVASTFDIANDDFLNGGALTFEDSRSTAGIVNDGIITTGEGGAHLIANQITNNGLLTSVGGNITLSGGGEVTLSNGVNYVQPTMETLASGISPTAGLIQNAGTIRATGAATSGGEVYLVNPNGVILHDGTIAAQSLIADSETIGGHVQLEADDLTLTANSSIDATGTHGGGEVLIGGDWQGSGEMTQATSVIMEAGGVIDASATQQGDGGKIVLWSDIANYDSATKVWGTLLARAGELFGVGGQIETSGATIDTDGISVDAGAANGDGGLWLIDPFDYVIDAIAASNIVSSLNSGTNVTVTTTADNASFGSSGNNADLGDITVTNDIVTGAMSGDATLTLQAARHINVDANIDATQNGNTAELNVTLLADTDSSGDGINIVSANEIKTNGGNLQFGDGTTANIGGATVKVGGDVYINGAVAQSIETGGGNITINGETIVANSSVSGVTFDSNGGDIAFGGLLNSGNQYTYVDGPDGQANSWDWARTDAKNGTPGGSTLGDSYMVTITSRLENAISGIAAGYRGAWIGAYRADPGGSYNWEWADGPEAGQTFFVQANPSGGSVQPGSYSNFGAGEPNGALSATGESRGQFFGNQGQWNDLNATTTFAATQDSQYSVLGYVRETNLSPTAVTIDAGTTGTVTMGGVGSGKALASLDVTSAGVIINGDALITIGAQDYDSALTLNSTIGLTVSGTTLTTGGALNFTAADNVTIDASLNVPSSITIQGDDITINGNVTSTDTGDIYIQSNSATNSSLRVYGQISKTGGDRSTLTLRGDGRVGTNSIVANGGAILDTVIWSDYHNTGSGGVSVSQDIDTNGGHFWAGGSASDGGSTTWNGLTVGDGSSVGADGFNWPALDLRGSITTSGGDALLWAGDGYSTGANGIGLTGNHVINAGSGDVTLLADEVSGAVLTIDTTGHFTFAPNSNAWSSSVIGGQLDFSGTISSNTFTGTGDTDWLTINNYSSLSGLTFGKDGNTSSIRVYNPIDIAGPVNLIGNNVTIDAGIDTSSSAGSEILLNASGDIVIAANQSLTTGGGNITFDGTVNSDGTARSLAVSPGTANAVFNANVGGSAALSALTVNGTADVNADITTSGAQNWTDTITLGGTGARSFTAGSYNSEEIVGGAQGINLITDSLTLNDTVTSTGALVIRPMTAGTSVGVGSGAGGLSINAGTLSLLQDGFSSITIGGTGAGELTVGDLSSLTDDLTLQAGSTSDLVVSGVLSWNTNETLTLRAGEDIHVLANMDIDGSAAGLNLYYGGTDGTTAPDSTNDFYINLADQKRVQFANPASSLKIGNEAYTLIDSLAELQGMVTSGRYALASDVSLTGNTYNDAFYTSTFTGKLEGFGNVVDGLTIRDNDGGNLGLFAQLNGATVRHLGVTGFDIKTDSSSTATDFRIGGLVGNVGGAGSSVANKTLLDGVWSTGSIATNSGSTQGIAFFGGLVGNQNGGTMELTRSFSTANASTQGSHTSTGLGIGGLVGDISLKTTSSFANTTSSVIAYDINRSYATGSVVQGTFGGYYGAGGLVGVTYSNGNTISDCYSWGNVVGTGSFGGIVGFGSGMTATRVYTKQSNFGNTGTYNSSYTSANLATATSNGTALPAGWSSDLWTVGEFPTLSALRVPPTSLFVKILAGNTSVYGNAIAPTYEVVDAGGTAIAFGTGIYSDVGTPTGTGTYTLAAGANAATHDISYLRGLTLTGDDASLYALNPFSTAGSYIVMPRSITAVLSAAGVNKVYDGNTNASSGYSPTWSFTNIVTGDSATLNVGSSSFNDANVLDANLFTINGLSLAGISGSNGSLLGDYSLANTSASVAANISAKPIVVDNINVSNKVYDGTTDATVDVSSATYSGAIFGDSVNIASVSGLFANSDVGSAKSVTIGGTLTGADAGNYTLQGATSPTADITAKTITLNGFDASNKVYDGTTTAIINNAGSLTGLVSGDSVTVDNTGATFADKNAATGKTVTLNGVALSGTDSANYTIASTATDIADITAKSITLNGFDASNKVYDGTTTATINNAGSLTGVISGDTVTVGNTGATFADEDAATGKTVTLNGVALSGTESANYTIASTATDTADIAAKLVTLSGFDAVNKVYDGTTTATINNAGSLTGVVSGDTVSVSNAGATFSDKNAGAAKTVTLNGVVLSGTDSANYSISATATDTADISAKTIVISGLVGNDRTYNGTTAATVDHSGVAFTGIVSGDTLTASGTIGVFADKHVGTGKTVTLSGTSYGGTDVGNYSFTDQSNTTADISARAIIVSGLAADDRVYDGTTVATIDHSGVTFTGIISGDNVTASGTTGAFNGKDVGTGKTVTLSGTTYGGTDVGNYSFSNQTTDAANITARAVVVSGLAGTDRVYDGTTVTIVDHSGVTFTGIISGDTLTASGTTGAFTDKHVGTGKTVTLSGTSYGGTDVGNYSFTDQSNTTGDISAKVIIVSGLAADDRVYDGTTVAIVDHSGVTFTGIISGDTLTASSTTGVFNSKDVGTGKTVTLHGTTYGGTDVGNYSFSNQATTTADVSQKKLTIGGLVTNDKVYNGSIIGTVDTSGITFSGLISGDDVTLDSVEGRFANKNVGTDKLVYLSAADTGGDDEGNYRIFYNALTRADITAKSITISGLTAADKIYDGTTSATVDVSGATFNGKISGDNLSATGTTGTFSDKNVGDGKTVTLAGTTYGGTDIGNYTITDQTSTTAEITQKSITVSGLLVENRVYDGSRTVTVDHSGATFDGIVSGDTLTTSGTAGTLDNKNVGTGKPVILSGATYGGSDVNNYDITDQTASTADITAKLLTIGGITANNKVYDGTTSATADVSGVTLNGLIIGDDIDTASTGLFADKHVADGKTITLTNVFSGDDVDNYSITSQTSTTANITPRAITISGITATDKTYDGNTVASVDLTGLNLGSFVAGDDLSVSATGLFDNKNVDSGKLVTLSSYYSGSDLSNYSIADQASTRADILRLGSVTWIGGATGSWSDPSNWAGGAIPDLANVADVIIPDGATPLFDHNVSGPVDIDSLTGGNLEIDSGTLGVANDVCLDDFTQHNGAFNAGADFKFANALTHGGTLDVTANSFGGTFTQNGGTSTVGDNFEVADFNQNGGGLEVGGRLDVTNSFYQSPSGSIDVMGDVDITHTTGDLSIGNLSGHSIVANSTSGGVHLGNITTSGIPGTLSVTAANGDIDQLSGTHIATTGESTFNATSDVTLGNSANSFGDTVNVQGTNVTLRDDDGGLILGSVVTPGILDVTSTDGPVTQGEEGVLTVGGSSGFTATQGGSDADIILSNLNNDFGGPVSAAGRHIELFDAHDGIVLHSIVASGDIAVTSSDGSINQTPDGHIDVAGMTTVAAAIGAEPADVELTNKSNNFHGTINASGGKVDFDDADGRLQFGEFKSVDKANILVDVSAEGVRDTNTRYSEGGKLSNTAMRNVVERYGQKWLMQLAEWLTAERTQWSAAASEEVIRTSKENVSIKSLN